MKRSETPSRESHKMCCRGLEDQTSYSCNKMNKACVNSCAVPPAPRGRYTKPARMTGLMFKNYLCLAGRVDFLILLALSRRGETSRLRLNDQIFQHMQEDNAQWLWIWTAHRIKSLEKRRYIANLSPRNMQGIYTITTAGTEALEVARGSWK